MHRVCGPGSTRRPKGRPLTVGLLGADILVLNRSDYGPFRSRGIPFLFFTTGENPRYHRPDDTADTLDYPKLTSISRMIEQVVAKAADAPAVPRWQKNPDDPFAEAVTIRDVLRLFVKNSETLKIGVPQLFLINNTLATLDGIVERGSITPDERARVIQAARVVLFTVLLSGSGSASFQETRKLRATNPPITATMICGKTSITVIAAEPMTFPIAVI